MFNFIKISLGDNNNNNQKRNNLAYRIIQGFFWFGVFVWIACTIYSMNFFIPIFLGFLYILREANVGIYSNIAGHILFILCIGISLATLFMATYFEYYYILGVCVVFLLLCMYVDNVISFLVDISTPNYKKRKKKIIYNF